MRLQDAAVGKKTGRERKRSRTEAEPESEEPDMEDFRPTPTHGTWRHKPVRRSHTWAAHSGDEAAPLALAPAPSPGVGTRGADKAGSKAEPPAPMPPMSTRKAGKAAPAAEAPGGVRSPSMGPHSPSSVAKSIARKAAAEMGAGADEITYSLPGGGEEEKEPPAPTSVRLVPQFVGW